MRAYVVRADPGGQWSVAWEQRPPPPCPADGVLVEPRAAALAWSDVLQQQGRYTGPVPEPPFVSGHEFAGVVVEASSSSGYQAGERVFGFLPGPGAFADRVAAPTRFVRRVPGGLSDAAAAAITTSFLTAHVGMFVVGGLTPGRSVLVHAAAGGVGRSALQLARAAGITPIVATAGTDARRSEAAALGATHLADYDGFVAVAQEATGGRGIDVALESVGGEVFDRTADVVRPLGSLVTVGASSGIRPRRLSLPSLWQRSVSVCGVHVANLMRDSPERLEPSWRHVLGLLADRQLDPGVGMVVGRDEIARGAEALHGRQVPGRVIIDLTTDLVGADGSTPEPVTAAPRAQATVDRMPRVPGERGSTIRP